MNTYNKSSNEIKKDIIEEYKQKKKLSRLKRLCGAADLTIVLLFNSISITGFALGQDDLIYLGLSMVTVYSIIALIFGQLEHNRKNKIDL